MLLLINHIHQVTFVSMLICVFLVTDAQMILNLSSTVGILKR